MVRAFVLSWFFCVCVNGVKKDLNAFPFPLAQETSCTIGISPCDNFASLWCVLDTTGTGGGSWQELQSINFQEYSILRVGQIR